MKLPSTAIIAPEKIKKYLLSTRRRNDKSKWLAKAGYKLNDCHKFRYPDLVVISGCLCTPVR